ncbi:MAG: hypothetical protein ACXVUL_05985 [Solirubrobacteraceae bacterium]
MFKFLHLRSSAAPPRAKRSPRVPSAKRFEPERPVRVYSLLLPPTLPDDRK